METLSVNYAAVVVGAVLAMAIGAFWYGPLFGKKWLQIIGASAHDLEARKKMQQSAAWLYVLQSILTLFQVVVLAHLVADTTRVGGFERSLFIWAAFVVPTLAGAVMWTNEPGPHKRARLLIQGGHQLIVFVLYGLLLQFWK